MFSFEINFFKFKRRCEFFREICWVKNVPGGTWIRPWEFLGIN